MRSTELPRLKAGLLVQDDSRAATTYAGAATNCRLNMLSPPSNSNEDSPLHPQRAIHKLSLLSSVSKSSVHLPTTCVSQANDITAIGADDAQAYWLNAARGIDWIKAPTVAYGKINSDARYVAALPFGPQPIFSPSHMM